MSFPKYSEYKNSGVERLGDVPEHWKLSPCRSIVEECTARNDSGRVTNYLSLMANVGVIRYEDKGDIGNKKPDDLAKCKIVRKGNLVINSMNYGIGSYGLSPYNGVCSPVYIVLQPKPSEIETQYALRVFEEKEFQSYAQSFGNGILAHRSAIGWDDLKNISIALPPLREQTQIARFLDHETARIDALIEEQQRLIELLKEKRQAVISHAVTKGLDPNVPMKDSGVEWLGEVPEHWEVTKLGWTVSELTYGFTNPMPTEDTGPAMLTANDIGWGRIHYDQARSTSDVAYLHLLTNKSRPKKGDLLLTKDGTLGRVAVHDGTPACINQSVALIRPVFKRLLPDFLCSVLQASCYQEKMLFDAGGTTIKHIYISTLAKMNLAIPPLSEQEALISFIARESKRFDLLISTARNGIELLKERRSALISAAVTGKIDVRNWQPEQSSVADTGEDYAMVAEQSAEYR